MSQDIMLKNLEIIDIVKRARVVYPRFKTFYDIYKADYHKASLEYADDIARGVDIPESRATNLNKLYANKQRHYRRLLALERLTVIKIDGLLKGESDGKDSKG